MSAAVRASRRLVVGGVVALAACGGGDGVPPVFRFIADEPAQPLPLDAGHTEELLHEWSLPGRTTVDGPDPNLPLFDRALELDAANVQIIEVTVESMPQGTLALRWRTPEHDFTKERQIQLQAEHLPVAPAKVFTFFVASHPLWRDRVTGLRLYCDVRQRQIVAPRNLRILHRRVDPGKLAAAVTRPWRVALGRDLRSALLVPPRNALRAQPDRATPRRAAGSSRYRGGDSSSRGFSRHCARRGPRSHRSVRRSGGAGRADLASDRGRPHASGRRVDRAGARDRCR